MSNDPSARIEIVPYNPDWPAQFEREKHSLDAVLSPWLVGAIEHIGSTAVVGLAAKPVIDLMAPVASLDASRAAIVALVTQCGYLHHPYRYEVMHWFCKPSPTVRTHHLHLVPRHTALWTERLAFRDALRASPSLRQEYATLKMRLAAAFPSDREAYTQAKTPFVQRVLATVAPPQGPAAFDRAARPSGPADKAPLPVNIRPYDGRDWPRVCEIHDAARLDELAAAGLQAAYLSLAQTAENESFHDYEIRVAEVGGHVMGFVAFTPDELAWLYVDPASYGQGLGTSLIRATLAEVDGPLSAEVLVGNVAALAVYRKAGFDIVGQAQGRMPGNEGFAVSVTELRHPATRS